MKNHVCLNECAVFVIEVYGVGVLLHTLNNYDAVGKDVFNRILSVLFGKNLIMVAAVRAVLDYRVGIAVRRVKEELEVEVSSAEDGFCVLSLADNNRKACFRFKRKCDIIMVKVNVFNRDFARLNLVRNLNGVNSAVGRLKQRSVIFTTGTERLYCSSSATANAR